MADNKHDSHNISSDSPDLGPAQIFIPEVQGHQRRYLKLIQFTHSSTKAAGVMLAAAIVALIVANGAGYAGFYEFWHTDVVLGFGENHVEMSLAHIINDIFMAIFFLLVGLEIKYEMTVGELTNIRQAALPIIAAVGGVIMPIVLFQIFNGGNPETNHGWGVPTATDIAFALGIMALLGNRVPSGIRVFLSTLAVADDIIAIIVIAIFYGQAPSIFWLVCAALVFCILLLLNKYHVYSLFPYMVLGAVLWLCVYLSGIHATIAGVLLAVTIPSGSRVNLRSFLTWSDQQVDTAREIYNDEKPVVVQEDYLEQINRLSRVARQVIPPATRLEHRLYPWVYFAILPLFALTNADVSLVGQDVGALFGSPVFFGVLFGLVVGKPIGIMLFSFLTVKSKAASLPENVNWMHMLGASILGGVGFTMAIFVANLAFSENLLVSASKLGILLASLVAGVVGFLVLLGQARKAEKKGVAYMQTAKEGVTPQRADSEAVRRYERMLEQAQEAGILTDEQINVFRRNASEQEEKEVEGL